MGSPEQKKGAFCSLMGATVRIRTARKEARTGTGRSLPSRGTELRTGAARSRPNLPPSQSIRYPDLSPGYQHNKE
jgi:hypothetical protein